MLLLKLWTKSVNTVGARVFVDPWRRDKYLQNLWQVMNVWTVDKRLWI